MPMRVGDLGYICGGRHPRHGSHRSGRDVDIIFYAVDAQGRATRGRGWVAYDRFGTPQGARRDEEMVFFDEARNWEFVERMVLDEEARVQWLFVSRGVKARLLRYAVASGADPEAIFRASLVLQQPSRSTPHADHFHVRIYCAEHERSLGCLDRGPTWPWHRRSLDEAPACIAASVRVGRLTDERVVRELSRDFGVDAPEPEGP
jgi:penicillin-insensitive murein endopeptidase